ncbi:MAG: hypothetical protein C0478_02370 [Planctomyces sp.]|nr:hypothetical protein [Planctomyces sp.]
MIFLGSTTLPLSPKIHTLNISDQLSTGHFSAQFYMQHANKRGSILSFIVMMHFVLDESYAAPQANSMEPTQKLLFQLA